MHKIFLSGAAGLVGQNLCIELSKSHKDFSLVGCDKNSYNLNILESINSSQNFEFICEDLSEKNSNWVQSLKDSDILIICHAQISSLNEEDFIRNNVQATKNLLEEAQASNIKKIIHISSSVINSNASDAYIDTKTQQENLIKNSGIENIILRPTLMFGALDRKLLGWLARFLKVSPIFPIPGNGRYVRQPLFVNDFCNIIISCINNNMEGVYDISGLEEVEYIEIIKLIRYSIGSYSLIIKMPITVFKFLLKMYSIFDKNPPFTSDQAEALITPETFPKIDWPSIFKVENTTFKEAVTKTYKNNKYSKIKMEF